MQNYPACKELIQHELAKQQKSEEKIVHFHAIPGTVRAEVTNEEQANVIMVCGDSLFRMKYWKTFNLN